MKSDYVKATVYNKVFPYMQYDNALCLRLCLETGLRVGDALKVKAEDIKGRTLHYVAEKTGKAGKKVLSHKIVTELLKNAGYKGYCFKGRNDPNKHRARQTVWRDVQKACKRAGVQEHVSPHSTRKTYAVNKFHEEGITQVQKELQHDRLDTTMIYAFADLLSNGTTKPYTAQSPTGGTLDIEQVKNIVYEACKRALQDFFKY